MGHKRLHYLECGVFTELNSSWDENGVNFIVCGSVRRYFLQVSAW